MKKLLYVIGICTMILITWYEIDPCYLDEYNVDYAYEKGNKACDYCFGEKMVSVAGGCAWSEITCTGEHNKLTMWAEMEPDEVSCHDRKKDCQHETEFLSHSTLTDYNCSQIKIMIETDSYINIVDTYSSIECFSNETYSWKTTDTAECKECAKDRWVRKYVTECT